MMRERFIDLTLVLVWVISCGPAPQFCESVKDCGKCQQCLGGSCIQDGSKSCGKSDQIQSSSPQKLLHFFPKENQLVTIDQRSESWDSLPDLSISQSQIFCGTHYLAKFTIQGGATVTCPTGELSVYAKEILIDPASTIEISGTSQSKVGKGEDYSFQNATCDLLVSGGGGGGNGEKGKDALDDACRVSAYTVITHQGSYGGEIVGDELHTSAFPGGMGGQGCTMLKQDTWTGPYHCTELFSGGAGGGVIRLIARDQLTMQGTLKAEGRAPNGSGEIGAGGGAGGTILLAAPDLQLSGNLSTQGGAGGKGYTDYVYGPSSHGAAGGMGRIKLLHGPSYKNSASLQGAVVTISILPPMFIDSATHPDSSRAYNDGFKTFDVEWHQPMQNIIGTYYAINQQPNYPLTYTNGKYTTSNRLSFPQSSMNQGGRWYLHLLTRQTTDLVGTVSNAFEVLINSKPHVIASNTHPDQDKWYMEKEVLLRWDPPQDCTKESFAGFYYRLDKCSETAPTNLSQGWSYTKDYQVLLTQDGKGQTIQNGAYHFHLVSVDSMGNASTNAGHFRLQIGPQPPQLKVFGYVKDASYQPLEGVAIRLEPYGISTSTDKNGYFLLTNIYQGNYDLWLKKSGYQEKHQYISIQSEAIPLNLLL